MSVHSKRKDDAGSQPPEDEAEDAGTFGGFDEFEAFEDFEDFDASRQDDARAAAASDRHESPSEAAQHEENQAVTPIAIVGMAGRFPGAADVDALWRLLADERHGMRTYTHTELVSAGLPTTIIDDDAYVPVRGAMADADRFDATLFRMSPTEAALTDPQHRKFLEMSWAALEDAAIDPSRFNGAIGVFGGCSPNTYLLNNLVPTAGALASLGGMAAVIASDKDHMPTRVAYKLGLTGPAFAIGSACSTSLVAVHLACESLRSGSCDAALAGGASIAVPLAAGHVYKPNGIASRDGMTRAFSADADGTTGGDAAAVVVLRRLADALRDGDPIRAVIQGSAVTNDGADRVGYTAPGVHGQSRAIRRALDQAGLSADSLDLIEAHGTATPLGDPIEVRALSDVLGRRRSDADPPCWLGSVKSNIGHTNAAAGVCGLIKATLALEHQLIPASLHATPENPALQLDQTRLRLATEAVPWPPSARPRHAGISSFGAGGTNAHIILGAAPARAATQPTASTAGVGLLLQGQTEAAVERQRVQLQRWLAEHRAARLIDVAATLATGRRGLARQAIWWIAPGSDAAEQLLRPADAASNDPQQRNIAFLVPGQGFQRVLAGRSAYATNPAFRAAFDVAADACLAAGGPDPRDFLHLEADAEAQQSRLDDQDNAGPFTLALGWATGRALIAAGASPDVYLGQSTGELAVAALAGVMTVQDAMGFMVARSALLRKTPAGACLFAPLSGEALQDHLPDGAWLALRNGPEASVATGLPDAIETLHARLTAAGISSRHVRVSVAAHSPLLAEIEAPLLALAARFDLRPPSVPMVSAVTGALLRPEEVTSPRYWARHTLQPVNLVGAFASLAALGPHALVELGPPRCMAGPALWNLSDAPLVSPLDGRPTHADPATEGRPTTVSSAEVDATDPIFRAMAKLACARTGLAVPGAEAGCRIHLPTYPFARQRHWVTPTDTGAATRASTPALSFAADVPTGDSTPSTSPGRALHPRPALSVSYRAASTAQEAAVLQICETLLGIAGIGVDDDFFSLGGDSLITMRLLEEVRRRHDVLLPAAAAFDGLTVARLAAHLPADAAGLDAFASLAGSGGHDASPGPAKPPAGAAATPRCLVPLRTTGGKSPLFFVHPAAGIVFPYFDLARTLPHDRPFWGLQAAGLDGHSEPDLDVPAMARRYVAAIRVLQPEGPYHLGAFSFGCYVIYEMALQLEDLGQKVALLALVDEAAPLDGHRPSAAMMSRIIFGRAGRTLVHHLHDYLFLRDASRNGGQVPTRRRDRTLRKLLQRSAMAALLPEESHGIALDQPAMAPLFRLLSIHLRETLGYTPRRAMQVSAVLFKSAWAEERPFWVRGDVDPTFGWSQLALGGVTIQPITGDHLAVIRQPHVKVLAAALAEALAEAERFDESDVTATS